MKRICFILCLISSYALQASMPAATEATSNEVEAKSGLSVIYPKKQDVTAQSAPLYIQATYRDHVELIPVPMQLNGGLRLRSLDINGVAHWNGNWIRLFALYIYEVLKPDNKEAQDMFESVQKLNPSYQLKLDGELERDNKIYIQIRARPDYEFVGDRYWMLSGVSYFRGGIQSVEIAIDQDTLFRVESSKRTLYIDIYDTQRRHRNITLEDFFAIDPTKDQVVVRSAEPLKNDQLRITFNTRLKPKELQTAVVSIREGKESKEQKDSKESKDNKESKSSAAQEPATTIQSSAASASSSQQQQR